MEKNLRISGPMQFISVLFKGQQSFLSPSARVSALSVGDIKRLRRQEGQGPALFGVRFAFSLIPRPCSFQDVDTERLPSQEAVPFRTGSAFSQAQLPLSFALSEEEEFLE